MKAKLIMFVSIVILTGCQSTQTANVKSADATASVDAVTEVAKADGSNVYSCRMEKIVGSKLPQRVCVSKSDSENMRESAQDKMRKFEENSGRVSGN